jgi:hypothetical protein
MSAKKFKSVARMASIRGGRGFRETHVAVMKTAFNVDRMFAKTTDKKHVA